MVHNDKSIERQHRTTALLQIFISFFGMNVNINVRQHRNECQHKNQKNTYLIFLNVRHHKKSDTTYNFAAWTSD